MGYGEKMKYLPPQMRWVKDNELIAVKCYLESRQKNGEAITCEQTGLHLLPEKYYLGMSSDGKLLCVSVDTCCYGCPEIKCPYSIDGSLIITLTPNEIAEKYGNKTFHAKGRRWFTSSATQPFLLCPSTRRKKWQS